MIKWSGSTSELADKVITQIGQAGFTRLAEEARAAMEPFVPYDTGALLASACVEATSRKGSVVYKAPYAAACYYGAAGAFKRQKHPLATAFWDRRV